MKTSKFTEEQIAFTLKQSESPVLLPIKEESRLNRCYGSIAL